jgi:hypothetical protein
VVFALQGRKEIERKWACLRSFRVSAEGLNHTSRFPSLRSRAVCWWRSCSLGLPAHIRKLGRHFLGYCGPPRRPWAQGKKLGEVPVIDFRHGHVCD